MLAKFKAWYAQPFNPDMNVTGWFLMFGLVLMIGASWKIILSHLHRGLQ